MRHEVHEYCSSPAVQIKGLHSARKQVGSLTSERLGRRYASVVNLGVNTSALTVPVLTRPPRPRRLSSQFQTIFQSFCSLRAQRNRCWCGTHPVLYPYCVCCASSLPSNGRWKILPYPRRWQMFLSWKILDMTFSTLDCRVNVEKILASMKKWQSAC